MHIHITRLNEQHVCARVLSFDQRQMYYWYLYFAYQNFLILFSSMGRCSLQMCVVFFSFWFFLLPFFSHSYWSCESTNYPNFFKVHKTMIFLEEIFYCQIFIHFSTCYKKSKKMDGAPGHSPYTLKTKLLISTTIIPRGILHFHCLPVSVMMHNNFSIIELDHLPTHHPSFFLLTLWHSLTWKIWHPRNIIIRLI